MESIRANDRYLDPPDIPTYGDCDRCHERRDYGDMEERNGCYYCDECYEAVLMEEDEDD